MGLACFPLSAAHYIETLKTNNPAARERLATTMRDISKGKTLTPPWQIMRYEVETALFKRFAAKMKPELIRPLGLLGSGLGHAFHSQELKITLADAEIDELDPAQQAIFPKIVRFYERQMEDDMLAGISQLTGEIAPSLDLTEFESGFKDHLQSLASRLKSLNATEREVAIYAFAIMDVAPHLSAALHRHAISWEEFGTWGGDGLTAFLEDLPAQRVTMQLHRQWAKNPDLKPKNSEIYDWGALGPYVMYCDVMVTEKLFADLIRREGFHPRAEVIADLRGLPQILTGLTR